MKKTFLTLGLFSAMTFAANAQDAATTSDFKPAAGNITVEVNAASPFAQANPFSLNGTGLGATPALRLRYFLSDNMAFRVQFNIDAYKYKQDLGSKADISSTVDGAAPTSGSANTTDATYKITSSRTLIAIAPGIEIHKNVAERLSVYYGGYIDFALQSAKGKVTGTPGSTSRSHTATSGATSSTATSTGDYSYEVKGQSFGNINAVGAPAGNWSVSPSAPGTPASITAPTFGTTAGTNLRNNGDRAFTRIGLMGVIGADYYITKALYLGLEVAWGFNTTTFRKITETETATNIQTTTVTVPAGPAPVAPVTTSVTSKSEDNKDSQLRIAPLVNAAFRFGFWF